MTDPWEPYREKVRTSYFGKCLATPYRLGIAVGEDGADLPPPPHYGPKARKNYLDGMVYARSEASK